MCFRLKWRTGSLVPPNPPLELTRYAPIEIVTIFRAGIR
jgi:hypothetical protein